MSLSPPLPDLELDTARCVRDAMEPGYHVIVWNDPVNLMSYVTHVFQKLFGWPREKAEHHMMEVHTLGKSVVAQETRERAEHYVHQLHAYRLQASCEPANQ